MTDPLIEALSQRDLADIIDLVGELDDSIVQSLLALSLIHI